MREATGASRAVAFDHNLRAKQRKQEGTTWRSAWWVRFNVEIVMISQKPGNVVRNNE